MNHFILSGRIASESLEIVEFKSGKKKITHGKFYLYVQDSKDPFTIGMFPIYISKKYMDSIGTAIKLNVPVTMYGHLQLLDGELHLFAERIERLYMLRPVPKKFERTSDNNTEHELHDNLSQT